MKGYHDIGGDAVGPIPKVELPWLEWEKRVEAIRSLLGDGTRRLISLDEMSVARVDHVPLGHNLSDDLSLGDNIARPCDEDFENLGAVRHRRGYAGSSSCSR